jgi:hypothetical protein
MSARPSFRLYAPGRPHPFSGLCTPFVSRTLLRGTPGVYRDMIGASRTLLLDRKGGTASLALRLPRLGRGPCRRAAFLWPLLLVYLTGCLRSQNCHSEGIRRGCPKNLNFNCSNHLMLGSFSPARANRFSNSVCSKLPTRIPLPRSRFPNSFPLNPLQVIIDILYQYAIIVLLSRHDPSGCPP